VTSAITFLTPSAVDERRLVRHGPARDPPAATAAHRRPERRRPAAGYGVDGAQVDAVVPAAFRRQQQPVYAPPRLLLVNHTKVRTDGERRGIQPVSNMWMIASSFECSLRPAASANHAVAFGPHRHVAASFGVLASECGGGPTDAVVARAASPRREAATSATVPPSRAMTPAALQRVPSGRWRVAVESVGVHLSWHRTAPARRDSDLAAQHLEENGPRLG